MEDVLTFNKTANNASFELPVPAKRDHLYIVIPITIIYSVIFVSGVTGNIVTCVVISRNKHMHTATNYYLFSLAISDLLLLVSGLPQEMYSIWSRYPYVFGEVFCVLRGLASETSANATVLTITAFTVERYVAICHPFYAQTLSKLSRAVRLILAIWGVALAFAIPQALQFGVTENNNPEYNQCSVKWDIIKYSFEISTFLFFALPMTLITVLYALIGVRLRSSALLKKSSGSFSNHQESRRGSCKSTTSRRVLKMLVVVAFFICWAPFHIQRLVAIYGVGQPTTHLMTIVYEVVTYISGILYYVSTTINPILYHIMSLKFREAFKGSFSRCCYQKDGRRSYAELSRIQKSKASLNSKSVTDSAASQSETRVKANTSVRRQLSESSYLVSEESKTQLELEVPVTCLSCQRPNLSSAVTEDTQLKLQRNISNSSLWDSDNEELKKELHLYVLVASKQHIPSLE